MLEIIQTADGSNTVFNSVVGEHYHSVHGAVQESRHVFIHSGLAHFLENSQAEKISILEVGFGTGLNFLLSADFCLSKNIGLNYTGIEAYPLSADIIGQTGYEKFVSPKTWVQFIGNYQNALTAIVPIHSNCKLQIAHCQLLDFSNRGYFDIIYFDAFASAHQSEMWDELAIAHTVRFLKPGGIFVTYAITGNLKRMLKSLNCAIEKIPGAAGKREMLRAVKLN